MNLREQLIRFEGWRNRAYPDPLTGGAPWGIGVGHTGPEVHEGLIWTDAQIEAALDVDIAEATTECRANLPWLIDLDEPRQAVLIGMWFQLKHPMDFAPTFALVRNQQYTEAAEHLRQSAWAKQTPNRVEALAQQLITGAWA